MFRILLFLSLRFKTIRAITFILIHVIRLFFDEQWKAVLMYCSIVGSRPTANRLRLIWSTPPRKRCCFLIGSNCAWLDQSISDWSMPLCRYSVIFHLWFYFKCLLWATILLLSFYLWVLSAKRSCKDNRSFNSFNKNDRSE